MVEESHRTLDFDLVDDLFFAVQKNRLELGRCQIRFNLMELGPALELTYLSDSASRRRLLFETNPVSNLIDAFDQGRVRWLDSTNRSLGFIRTRWPVAGDQTEWLSFALTLQRAAQFSGFEKAIANKFIAAIIELYTNIYEHSLRSESGIIAFQSSPQGFEFVIADAGIGVLRSLKSSSKFSNLIDHGQALLSALTEGVSRIENDPGRGRGFRQMFLSLRELEVSLRFRSGNQALLLTGNNPTLTDASIREKPYF